MEPLPEPRDYEPIQPRGTDWRGLARKIFAPLAAIAGALLKFSFLFFKFASIFVAVGGYALIWGWRFAIGFVLLILVHEMGHYVQARLEGIHASLPIFIPFLGAFVALQHVGLTPWRHAKIALAGPIAGGAASTVAFLDGGATWLAIGYLRRGGAPNRAFAIGLLYGATALALALGMWAAHVHQSRL